MVTERFRSRRSSAIPHLTSGGTTEKSRRKGYLGNPHPGSTLVLSVLQYPVSHHKGLININPVLLIMRRLSSFKVHNPPQTPDHTSLKPKHRIIFFKTLITKGRMGYIRHLRKQTLTHIVFRYKLIFFFCIRSRTVWLNDSSHRRHKGEVDLFSNRLWHLKSKPRSLRRQDVVGHLTIVCRHSLKSLVVQFRGVNHLYHSVPFIHWSFRWVDPIPSRSGVTGESHGPRHETGRGVGNYQQWGPSTSQRNLCISLSSPSLMSHLVP